MNKRWQAYGQHILDTIQKLRRIRERGDLTRDEILYDAALRNLQTLSEATQRLPVELRLRHAAIPWKEINGFRNILVLNYLGEIDAETVLIVLERDIPPLEAAVKAMLAGDDAPD